MENPVGFLWGIWTVVSGLNCGNKDKGTSYGMMELSKSQNNLKMEELAGLVGMLRPGSLVLLWCFFHLGDLMTHWPPPPGFGQDNSERLLSKTVRAKQTEGLACPLFSLSPIWDTPLRLCHILPMVKLNGHRFFCPPFHSYPVMLSWESEAVRELLPGAFVFRSKMNRWIGKANILKKVLGFYLDQGQGLAAELGPSPSFLKYTMPFHLLKMKFWHLSVIHAFTEFFIQMDDERYMEGFPRSAQ